MGRDVAWSITPLVHHQADAASMVRLYHAGYIKPHGSLVTALKHQGEPHLAADRAQTPLLHIEVKVVAVGLV
jgi:hypothetical protein